MTHTYPVTVEWTGGRDGSGQYTPEASAKTIPLAVAPEFGGPGVETNPEEMLSAAVGSCYSVTLGIILTNRKIPFTSIQTKATGEVDQTGMNFVFTKITLRPVITLAPDATDEQFANAETFSHKADSYCIVTNAVRAGVEIILEPTVVRG